MLDTTPRSPSPDGLGPMIRMHPRKAVQLPFHPSLVDVQTGKGIRHIQEFAAAALDEAEQFMNAYLPTFTSKDTKSSPPSTAQVEVFEKTVSSHDISKITGIESKPPENWFARKSIHENKVADGTASWEEFDSGVRENHSVNEKEYTPGVKDAHQVLDWASIIDDGNHVELGGWTGLTANMMEMVHKIPPPLQNRVFPVLVITAKKGDMFLVVQIPVDLEGIPGHNYHTNTSVQTGTYCSIERCRLVDGGEKVEWTMATASDAKGVLPMFIQKLGVPGAVVKDVGFFMKWRMEKRKQ